MEKDYRNILIKKCKSELISFENDLLDMEPKFIIRLAYELVIKREMSDITENGKFSPESTKALSELKYPLDSCYREWLHNDMTYMDMLQDSIEDVMNKELRKIREDKRRSR